MLTTDNEFPINPLTLVSQPIPEARMGRQLPPTTWFWRECWRRTKTHVAEMDGGNDGEVLE